MEARELLASKKESLEDRINRLRDVGVAINGVRYRYNFAQISAATEKRNQSDQLPVFRRSSTQGSRSRICTSTNTESGEIQRSG